MKSHLTKRKKSVFNTYKTVRTNIHLNKANNQSLLNSSQIVADNNNWEANWIEQATDMRSEISTNNQTIIKQNKLIIKWWEN